jgi:copper chaperone NosL
MRKKYIILVLLQVIAITFFLQSLNANDSSEIVKCSRCLMKIEDSKKKYSVTTPGRVIPVAFDDISCALLFRDELCARDRMEFDYTARVHDYYTEEMLKMTDAVYVIGSPHKTPMDCGVVAFKDRGSAEKFIAEQGKGNIIEFNAVIEINFHGQEK